MTERSEGASPYAAPLAQELNSLIALFPDAVSVLERDTVRYYFGIDGVKKLPVKAACHKLNLDEKEFTCLRERAMRKLYMVAYRRLEKAVPKPKAVAAQPTDVSQAHRHRRGI